MPVSSRPPPNLFRSSRPFRISLAILGFCASVCGGAASWAASNRIPGDFDPATNSFRLYPRPQKPAGASYALYGGTLQITADVSTTIPAGTKINSHINVYVSDPSAGGGGFYDSVSGTLTSNGSTATATYGLPYYAWLSNSSDQITVLLFVSAYYASNGVNYGPGGSGSATIPLPANGKVTAVTISVGM